jgi:hypothetical protein
MTFRALPSEPDLASADAPIEPLRFLAGGGSELERRLLSSARLDRVPPAAAARVGSRLGLDPVPVPKPSAWLTRFGRLGALGGVGGFAVVAALGWISASHIGHGTDVTRNATISAPPPVVAAVAPASEAASAAVIATSSSESPAAPEAISAQGSSTAPVENRSRAARSPARPALAHAERVPAGGLMAELRALEAVQTALRQGRAAEAEVSLAAYRAAFRSGELAPEAEMLRIDVALARGEHDRALALARAFARQPEAARYRERLAALLTPRIEGAGRPHWEAEAPIHDAK